MKRRRGQAGRSRRSFGQKGKRKFSRGRKRKGRSIPTMSRGGVRL